MWHSEQNQAQHAIECCNKQRETAPCFHRKQKLGAIFIKNNVLSFQCCTAKQLYLGVFHSLLWNPERFAAITAEARSLIDAPKQKLNCRRSVAFLEHPLLGELFLQLYG